MMPWVAPLDKEVSEIDAMTVRITSEPQQQKYESGHITTPTMAGRRTVHPSRNAAQRQARL